MREQDFEARLAADGFTEIETKKLAPRPANHGHTHDCMIRGMVLDGEFTVACGGEAARRYQPGEVFEVAAGVRHTEAVGDTGARIVVGRRFNADLPPD